MAAHEDGNLHILKMTGDWFQLEFANGDGSMIFNVCVPDNSRSDAQRKSQALGKLRKVLDALNHVMNDHA